MKTNSMRRSGPGTDPQAECRKQRTYSAWPMKSGARWFLVIVIAFLACSPYANDRLSESSSKLAGSSFESADGNLIVNGGTGAVDWGALTAPELATGIDLPAGQTDNALGQGSKEDSPIPTVVNGSIPNNKSDLTRFYVASAHIGTQDFLYLAWERAETLGTANMDFEFNQSTALSTNGITPVRTAGDILITFDFSSGGNVVS